jgi:RNA 3'-terminal phosphate cyclase (ATP)
MLVIDGAVLEGGGQIVRSAAALSAITGKDIKIINIRKKRQNPGLSAQHCTAVLSLKELCSARVEGCIPRSMELTFRPGRIKESHSMVDCGTAGSIPLVLQAWLPAALGTGGSLTVRGGTEVPMSPTIDYFTHVFLPVLKSSGAGIDVEIMHRGYYPRGNGEVRVIAEPSSMTAIDTGIVSDICDAGIVSCSANLPDHVASRQADGANEVLKRHTGYEFPVFFDRRTEVSTGTSVTAWKGCKGGVGLGRRGYPAEKVGEDAAKALVNELEQAGNVDPFLADQLLIYLAQYGGRFSTHTVSLHAMTGCWLLEQFGFRIGIKQGDPVMISA